MGDLMPQQKSKVSPKVSTLLRRHYPSARSILRARDDGTDRFGECVANWLQSAEKARRWLRAVENGYEDPDPVGRRMDQEFSAEAGRRNNALRQLQRDINRFPEHWALALASAISVLRKEGWTIKIDRIEQDLLDQGDTRRPSGAAAAAQSRRSTIRALPPSVGWLALLLAETEGGLQQSLRLRKAAYLHHVRRGALALPRPMKPCSRRLNEIATSLMFELAFTARLYTSGGTFVVQVGDLMPDFGDPCWEVVATFVNDALGRNYGRNDVETLLTRFLKRNPGVGWGYWQDPPPEFCSDRSADM